VRRALCEQAGKLDLVKKRLSGGGSFAPLEAFSTDFTQLNYRNGKALPEWESTTGTGKLI